VAAAEGMAEAAVTAAAIWSELLRLTVVQHSQRHHVLLLPLRHQRMVLPLDGH
jgi:hypothetical protein